MRISSSSESTLDSREQFATAAARFTRTDDECKRLFAGLGEPRDEPPPDIDEQLAVLGSKLRAAEGEIVELYLASKEAGQVLSEELRSRVSLFVIDLADVALRKYPPHVGLRYRYSTIRSRGDVLLAGESRDRDYYVEQDLRESRDFDRHYSDLLDRWLHDQYPLRSWDPSDDEQPGTFCEELAGFRAYLQDIRSKETPLSSYGDTLGLKLQRMSSTGGGSHHQGSDAGSNGKGTPKRPQHSRVVAVEVGDWPFGDIARADLEDAVHKWMKEISHEDRGDPAPPLPVPEILTMVAQRCPNPKELLQVLGAAGVAPPEAASVADRLYWGLARAALAKWSEEQRFTTELCSTPRAVRDYWRGCVSPSLYNDEGLAPLIESRLQVLLGAMLPAVLRELRRRAWRKEQLDQWFLALRVLSGDLPPPAGKGTGVAAYRRFRNFWLVLSLKGYPAKDGPIGKDGRVVSENVWKALTQLVAQLRRDKCFDDI